MTETGVNGALAWPAAPIVWMDYRRQKGGQIVASNAAPAMLYAALANRLKHWKLALWRRPRVAVWGIQGLVIELCCPTIALYNADVIVYYCVTY